MSGPEELFNRTAPWPSWTSAVCPPSGTARHNLINDVPEVGAASGSMALETLDTHPDARLTLTDIERKMVAAKHALRFTATMKATRERA